MEVFLSCCTSCSHYIASAHMSYFCISSFYRTVCDGFTKKRRLAPCDHRSALFILLGGIKLLFIPAGSYQPNHITPARSHLRMSRFNERERDGQETGEGQRVLVGVLRNHQKMVTRCQKSPPCVKGQSWHQVAVSPVIPQKNLTA